MRYDPHEHSNAGIIEREGEPPPPMVSVPNPLYDQWIERVAVKLCHPRGPSPCAQCFGRARDVARWARNTA